LPWGTAEFESQWLLPELFWDYGPVSKPGSLKMVLSLQGSLNAGGCRKFINLSQY